jgi:hypothetical protein
MFSSGDAYAVDFAPYGRKIRRWSGASHPGENGEAVKSPVIHFARKKITGLSVEPCQQSGEIN